MSRIRKPNYKRIVLRCSLAALLASSALTSTGWSQEPSPNVVIQWNQAALQGVRDSKLGPPMVSRALAIVHTCIYDAWAAYDKRALGTRLGSSLRQLHKQHTLANKDEAISFGAYRALVDLFPMDEANVFRPLMEQLGYNPDDTSVDTHTPSGVGNVTCDAVLQFRHHDGSNQLGDLSGDGVPYADYTGYKPLNPPSIVPVDPGTVADPNHWQPLQYFDATHTFVTQPFVGRAMVPRRAVRVAIRRRIPSGARLVWSGHIWFSGILGTSGRTCGDQCQPHG